MSDPIERKIAKVVGDAFSAHLRKCWEDSSFIGSCDMPMGWEHGVAPEVKRLIEAAYQQGAENGITYAASQPFAPRDRMPKLTALSWDALLSREETP